MRRLSDRMRLRGSVTAGGRRSDGCSDGLVVVEADLLAWTSY
jgi:hypothetical protein